MSELDLEKNEPFICVEITNKNINFEFLRSRLDKLFPDRIVRLIIDKKYSSFFYLGNGIWTYKKFPQKNTFNFEFEIDLDESAQELLNEELGVVYEELQIPIQSLKVIRNTKIFAKEHFGCFFSNGYIHIFDQFIIDDVYNIRKFFVEFLLGNILFDNSNDEESGVVIIKTNENIIGEIK